MARQWTKEARKKQSDMMKKNRIWDKSTGPKTEEGKKSVAQNAYKHGFRSQDYDGLLRLLRAQKCSIQAILSD